MYLEEEAAESRESGKRCNLLRNFLEDCVSQQILSDKILFQN